MSDFKRDTKNGWFGGVCASLGKTIDVPVWFVRLLFVCGMINYSLVTLAYLFLWVISEEEGDL